MILGGKPAFVSGEDGINGLMAYRQKVEQLRRESAGTGKDHSMPTDRVRIKDTSGIQPASHLACLAHYLHSTVCNKP